MREEIREKVFNDVYITSYTQILNLVTKNLSNHLPYKTIDYYIWKTTWANIHIVVSGKVRANLNEKY